MKIFVIIFYLFLIYVLCMGKPIIKIMSLTMIALSICLSIYAKYKKELLGDAVGAPPGGDSGSIFNTLFNNLKSKFLKRILTFFKPIVTFFEKAGDTLSRLFIELKDLSKDITQTMAAFNGFVGSVENRIKKTGEIFIFMKAKLKDLLGRQLALLTYFKMFSQGLKITMSGLLGKPTQCMVKTLEKWAKPMMDVFTVPWKMSKFFCFGKDTMITMRDNTVKNILDIKLGDTVKYGGKVLGILCFSRYCGGFNQKSSLLYDIDGITVSGSHLVWDSYYNLWVRVKDSSKAKHIDRKEDNYGRVFSLITENHLLISGNTLFSDYEEVSKPHICNKISSLIYINKNGLDNEIDNRIDNEIESDIDNVIDNEIESDIDNGIESDIDNGIESDIDNGIDNEIESDRDNRIDNEIESVIDTTIDSEINNGIELNTDSDNTTFIYKKDKKSSSNINVSGFHYNTLIKLADKTLIPIYKIRIGDVLYNNSRVIGIVLLMKESVNPQEYSPPHLENNNTNRVIVSGGSWVKERCHWKEVENSAFSKPIEKVDDFFSVVTNTGEISVYNSGGDELANFSDFLDTHDKTLNNKIDDMVTDYYNSYNI